MLAYIPAPWILWELPNPQQTFTKTVAKSTASRRKTCSSSSPSPHWERHRHCNASGPATLPSFSLFFRMKKRWAKCQTFNWEIHKSTFSMDLLEGKFIYENYGAPYAFCIYPKGLFFVRDAEKPGLLSLDLQRWFLDPPNRIQLSESQVLHHPMSVKNFDPYL